jgi:hypothetical protein
MNAGASSSGHPIDAGAMFATIENLIAMADDVRLTNDVARILTITQVPLLFTTRALQLYEQRRSSPYGMA